MYRVNVGILALVLSTICLISDYAKVEALAVNRRGDTTKSDQTSGALFRRDEAAEGEAPGLVEPPVEENKEKKHKGRKGNGEHKGRKGNGGHKGHKEEKVDEAQKRSDDTTMSDQTSGALFRRDEAAEGEAPGLVEPPVEENKEKKHKGRKGNGEHKGRKGNGGHKGHKEEKVDEAQKRSDDTTMSDQTSGALFRRDEAAEGA
ncbi:hypothetical protein BB561_006240 [Smittium simulii]|uniref:Uncharacterized protein n=1 Tax=Smittium simulii TaxID=133385 RepID=A0A2T9Y5N6_9FUNG|nr:hypothetical protein BB561_006240 [Smittium simulii]